VVAPLRFCIYIPMLAGSGGFFPEVFPGTPLRLPIPKGAVVCTGFAFRGDLGCFLYQGQGLPISGAGHTREPLFNHSDFFHKKRDFGGKPKSLLELQWCRRRDLNPRGFPNHSLKQDLTLQQSKCG